MYSNIYPVQHLKVTWSWKDSSNDATQSHKKCRERHMLLAHPHHQWTQFIFNKDTRYTLTAFLIAYNPLLYMTEQKHDHHQQHTFSHIIYTQSGFTYTNYITYPFCNRKLVHVHWKIGCVQFGGHNRDKILKQSVFWKHTLRTESYNPNAGLKNRDSIVWFAFICIHLSNADSVLWVVLDKHCSMLKDLRSNVIFSMPSRGLMCPGTSFPKDKWSIRCEKL